MIGVTRNETFLRGLIMGEYNEALAAYNAAVAAYNVAANASGMAFSPAIAANSHRHKAALVEIAWGNLLQAEQEIGY